MKSTSFFTLVENKECHVSQALQTEEVEFSHAHIFMLRVTGVRAELLATCAELDEMEVNSKGRRAVE